LISKLLFILLTKMDKFNELATFVDKIHKQLKEQDYINLMNKLSDLREDIETKQKYKLKIQFIFPHLVLVDENEYQIVEEEMRKDMIFCRKDIQIGVFDSETKIDSDDLIGKSCCFDISGKIKLDFSDREVICFRVHNETCDDKANDDCANSCPWLRHSYNQTKLLNIEKI